MLTSPIRPDEELPEPDDRRLVEQKVPDHQDPAGRLGFFHHALGIVHRERERLLHEEVFSRAEGLDRELGVGRRRRCHDHGIDRRVERPLRPMGDDDPRIVVSDLFEDAGIRVDHHGQGTELVEVANEVPTPAARTEDGDLDVLLCHCASKTGEGEDNGLRSFPPRPNVDDLRLSSVPRVATVTVCCDAALFVDHVYVHARRPRKSVGREPWRPQARRRRTRAGDGCGRNSPWTWSSGRRRRSWRSRFACPADGSRSGAPCCSTPS